MKRLQPYVTVFAILAFGVSLLVTSCAGVKPLEKGQTVRCPSCGAEFTIEEGLEEKERNP